MLVWMAPALAGALFHAVTAVAAAHAAAAVPIALVAQYGPAGELENLGATVIGAISDLVLATVAGFALARLMVSARVPWSWAALAGFAAAAGHAMSLGALVSWVPLVGSIGWRTAALGAWVAAWRAASAQHAQASEQSGLLGRAGCRRTPAEVLALAWRLALPASAVVARGLWASTQRRAADGGCGSARWSVRAVAILRTALASLPHRPGATGASGGIVLGQTAGRRSVVVPARHTVVVGASGAGKTVTMRRILSVASATMGMVVVDGKGDVELAADLERLAARSGRRFLAWSPTATTRYSPFSHGSDTEIVDKALAAESWGDDYYLRLGQRFLGFAVRALRAADRELTLGALARYVDPDRLPELAPEIEQAHPGAWNDLMAAIPALDRGERQAIAGTQHRLATMAESDVGHLLEPAPGHPVIDLLAVVANGDVAYFNLSADSRPTLSRMVGAAVIRDLVSISATVIGSDAPRPTVVALDDIQAFATEASLSGVASLFARGRQAGMMLLLGTQSLADLDSQRDGGTMDQLMDNRASLVVHRLPGHRSAVRASQELGDHEEPVVTEHLSGLPGGWRSSGSGTRSRAQVPNVRARELMDLPTGVAVVKSTGLPPCLVQVTTPQW